MMLLLIFGITSFLFPFILDILRRGRHNILEKATDEIKHMLRLSDTFSKRQFTQGNVTFIETTHISYKVLHVITLLVVSTISFAFVVGVISLSLLIAKPSAGQKKYPLEDLEVELQYSLSINQLMTGKDPILALSEKINEVHKRRPDLFGPNFNGQHVTVIFDSAQRREYGSLGVPFPDLIKFYFTNGPDASEKCITESLNVNDSYYDYTSILIDLDAGTITYTLKMKDIDLLDDSIKSLHQLNDKYVRMGWIDYDRSLNQINRDHPGKIADFVIKIHPKNSNKSVANLSPRPIKDAQGIRHYQLTFE